MPYLLVYGSTNCSTSCPDGQYSNASANSCFVCNINCNTCLGTSRNCTTCTLTATGILLYLENNICVQTCSISMYQNISNNTCMPCNLGCLTCSGPSLYECYSCRNATDPSNSSNLLIYYLTVGKTICDLICPKGQYINLGFPNYCQNCSVQCIGCVTTSYTCIEAFLCSLGYYYYRPTNSCLSVCPDGFYPNSTTGYCEPCPGGCKICSAGNLNSCSVCQTDPASSINYYK